MSGHHALLLAAGAGRRFGGGKMLATWRGEPLVRAAARAALAASVESCLVVTGCGAPGVEAALEGLGGPRLRVLRAAAWPEGLSASLRAGIAALPPDCAGAVVFLGDMPRIPHELGDRLIAALEAGAAGAEVLWAGRPAHPVAFARRLFPRLMALRGDAGGRQVLSGRRDVARIETDQPGAAFDVDRREDLEA